MNSLVYLLISFILLVKSPMCNFYKVLVVSPLPIKSHAILNHALVKILLEEGYEVTYVTVIRCKKFHPNLKQIDLSSNGIPAETLMSSANAGENNKERLAGFVTDMFSVLLQHKSTHRLLSDIRQTFDLIIAEWFFNDIFTGLAALYDCPFIWFASTEHHGTMHRLIGNNHVSTSLGKNIHERAAFTKIFEPLMVIRGKQLGSYDQLRSIASLVLVNSHVNPGEAAGWPKKFIPIAGYHINKNPKPLPKDLKSVMDNAKLGVIYFSMGTSMVGQDIADELKLDLVDMFSRLKQTVIWKLESEFLYLPSNVHILEWTPQRSILSHPNCILFITHGGVLSKIEAIHFGVPMIGIPIFGDQFTNIESAVAKGIAMKVNVSYSMADDIEQAILEMLRKPSYRQKVKQLSLTYRNRATTPREDLIYWINSTIRSSNRYHKESVFNIGKTYLDLFFMIAILILVAYAIRRSFSTLLKENK